MTRALEQSAIQSGDLSGLANANLLINGFHNISQENGANAKALTAGAAVYATDQWQAYIPTGSAGTAQQVFNPFPTQPDISYGLKLNFTTAQASIGTNDYVAIQQPIEGTNLARLAYGYGNAKPVTIVFILRPSINLTGYVSLYSGTSLRTYATRFTAVANTDNFIALTIPGDIGLTLNTSNVMGLIARWCFGAGTGVQSVANTWASSNILAANDITNLAATVGNNVIISGAVILPGIVPISQVTLPILARLFDDELNKCRRYWQTTYPYGALPGSAYTVSESGSNRGLDAATAYPILFSFFKTSMRVKPTCAMYAHTGALGMSIGTTVYTNATITASSVDRVSAYEASGNSFPQGAGINAHFTANARM